ncbi:Microprocessor complex subunit DGCR8 [Halotydeus destructor]|nr:Microprocessor complex subunit DGCR8 [Halotydeus destructor]
MEECPTKVCSDNSLNSASRLVTGMEFNAEVLPVDSILDDVSDMDDDFDPSSIENIVLNHGLIGTVDFKQEALDVNEVDLEPLTETRKRRLSDASSSSSESFEQDAKVMRLDEQDENSEASEEEYDSSEIDDLLDESLKNKSSSRSKKGITHEERKKTVLKKRNHDYFEVLPAGWIEVFHFSGMPVYLHKQSRVCTLSKPYHLGPGSARKHDIPTSAIPCLQYRKELDKEAQAASAQNGKEENGEAGPTDNHAEDTDNNTSQEKSQCPMMSKPIPAKVESIKESKQKCLTPIQVQDYCRKLFEFQEITIRKFKTWADRRKHMQERKVKNRPSLPEGTKLITCPLPPVSTESTESGNNNRKEFVMNPAGKSSVCILHEFVQHAMRVQPQYRFQELENASVPYSATVMINGMAHGVGYGSSKKQAKAEAARTTLELLIPSIKDMVPTDNNKPADPLLQDLNYFDNIDITDSRVSELCSTAGQYSPYQVLVECLKRNFGMGDTDITTSIKLLKHQRNEFTMTVGGKHTASVICKNKRDGKQRAAQHILAKLHPQIQFWGPLLRLYGRGSCKTPKEKKVEELKITELQSTACANKPNYAILNKLKDEMDKLRLSKENCSLVAQPKTVDVSGQDVPDSNLKHISL